MTASLFRDTIVSMELTKLIVESLGKDCVCGRERIPIHCRSCGSTNRYARGANSRTIELESGTRVLCQGFKCRYCGFDYEESTECQAPPQRSALKKTEVVGKLKLTDEEMQRVLRPVDTTHADRRKVLGKLLYPEEHEKASP